MASSKATVGRAQAAVLRAVLDGYNKNVDHLLDAILNRRKQSVQRTVDILQNRSLIVFNGESLELTELGRLALENSESGKITIDKSHWDGTWRIVTYDIPEEMKRERDQFRRRLRELDFTLIQQSMWLIPWECKEVVAVMAEELSLNPYIIYLLTDSVPGQVRLKSKYNL